MANLLITEKCIRSCPYCFAKKHMDSSIPDTIISWDDLIYVVDLLEGSGERHISLLGGEPTLHPYFIEFVIYLLQRGFHVTVFTSAVISHNKLQNFSESLKNVNPDQLSFVVNLNHPEISNIKEQKKVDEFLYEFNHYATLGYNIYKPDFNLEFLVEKINNFGLNRNIRIGIAHPIPGENNSYIKVEELKTMIDNFMKHLPIFEQYKIVPGFDCGLPLCMISEMQLGQLFKISRGHVNFGCGPAVDIGPNMEVWSCFPLWNFNKRSIFEFNSLQEIRAFFDELHQKVRTEMGGILFECDTCNYRMEGMCSGGCLAHILGKFNNEAKVRVAEIYK